jgi:hypothetical protein
VARRRIDLHDKITDSLVKETYEVGRVLGHGASGDDDFDGGDVYNVDE